MYQFIYTFNNEWKHGVTKLRASEIGQQKSLEALNFWNFWKWYFLMAKYQKFARFQPHMVIFWSVHSIALKYFCMTWTWASLNIKTYECFCCSLTTCDACMTLLRHRQTIMRSVSNTWLTSTSNSEGTAIL